LAHLKDLLSERSAGILGEFRRWVQDVVKGHGCRQTQRNRPEGINVFKTTAQQTPMQASITDNRDPRGITTDPWGVPPEFDRSQTSPVFSEKIPEVWKNTNFETMPFRIEKCRDLK
jgi:hypothetical protein